MATNQELFKRRARSVPRGPFNVAQIFVERAEGAKLWDVEGKEYIDFCGGIGVVNVGHNHPRVLEAIREQADKFIHPCWHVTMYEPYVRLCERLNELASTGGPNKTALFNSGAEAVENAVKVARSFTKRQAVVAFERGFHGRTLLGMTLTGKVKPYAEGFGPFAPEVYRLPYEPFFDSPEGASKHDVVSGALAALDHLFHYQIDAGSIACVVVEPVLGEGGFFPAHPDALRALREACTKKGILLVADEVQTGFGRCGRMLACEHYGIQPDIICTAKSLAAGMPLSAVTGKAEIMDAPQIGGLGGTYGGNPLACAAANTVLDIMAEQDLPARARDIGERVMQSFRKLQVEHEHVDKARGLGAMCAFEIVDGNTGVPDPERTKKVLGAALDAGLLAMSASGNVIRTLMPLVISDEDLERGLKILEQSVADAA
jgi:4-aminobutyrate aminotransferase/(S)-3-amino-2-methylpropionate transaminase